MSRSTPLTDAKMKTKRETLLLSMHTSTGLHRQSEITLKVSKKMREEFGFGLSLSTASSLLLFVVWCLLLATVVVCSVSIGPRSRFTAMLPLGWAWKHEI
jgi:hypothetical protein